MSSRISWLTTLILLTAMFAALRVNVATAVDCQSNYCPINCGETGVPLDLTLSGSMDHGATMDYPHCQNKPTDGSARINHPLIVNEPLDVTLEIRYRNTKGGASFQPYLNGVAIGPPTEPSGSWGVDYPTSMMGTLVGTYAFKLGGCNVPEILQIKEVTMLQHSWPDCCDHGWWIRMVELGSANRNPCAPPASSTAPKLAARP